MYLKRGLQVTLKTLRKEKWIVVTLSLLQLIFFVLAAYFLVTYQVDILTNAQDITTTMQGANLNPDSIEAGEPFLKDISQVYDNYSNMMQSILRLVLIVSGLYSLFHSVFWIFTHYLLEKRKEILLSSLFKFFTSTLLLLAPPIIIFCVLLKKYVFLLTSAWPYLLAVFFILYYLALVSYAFIHVKSWKRFVHKTFKQAILRIHFTFPVLLINLLLITASIMLIYYSVELLWLNILLLLLCTFLITMTRIFWIACLNENKKSFN